jgi:tetratricopeptide (TPR) repeat protein
MDILTPQYGAKFVGRETEINELFQKTNDSSIVVVKGDRGIGKTNLMCVLFKKLKNEGKKCYFIYRGQFLKEMNEIFKPSLLSKISAFNVSATGFGFQRTSVLSEQLPLKEMIASKEKFIFVEDAFLLDETTLDIILATTNQNKQIRFILEIPTPYVRDLKLKAGSYKSVIIKNLDDNDTAKLVDSINFYFSESIANEIVKISKGYPYIARSLVFICSNKNNKEQMHEFLRSLWEDEIDIIQKIHDEILELLTDDAKDVVKKLAIAPPLLTPKLIEAFCDGDIDNALNDLIKRGIIKSEKELYWIYHPLFRDYLRYEEGRKLEKDYKKKIYCKAMEQVKSEYDSYYILVDVLKEIDIFKTLIDISENCDAVNLIGEQCFNWGEIRQSFLAWSHILDKSDDNKWKSIAIGNIGLIYSDKGEADEALKYLQQALEIDREIGFRQGEASALGNIGLIYSAKGEADEALKYQQQALEIDREIGFRQGEASALGNIGLIYRAKGEADEALKYHKQALEIHREIGFRQGEASDLGNIGLIYRAKGEADEALKYHKQALEIHREIGYRQGEASQLGNIGLIYSAKGEADEALKYHQQALEIDREIGFRQGEASDLGNIGLIYSAKGAADEALKYLQQALEIHREIGYRQGEASALGNIGLIYSAKGAADEALKYHQQALEIHREIGYRQGEASALGNIGLIYSAKGAADEALKYHQQALEIFEAIGAEHLASILKKIINSD